MAARIRAERVHKGNPHQLVRHQHTISKRTINRFASSAGMVQVVYLPNGKRLRQHPDDTIFCADRVWDEHTETEFMK